MTLTDVQTEAIVIAKHWLSYGQRGLVAALAILEDAAGSMLGAVYCAECDCRVIDPVRDPVEMSWLGAAARTYCSQTCLDADDETAADVDGNR